MKLFVHVTNTCYKVLCVSPPPYQCPSRQTPNQFHHPQVTLDASPRSWATSTNRNTRNTSCWNSDSRRPWLFLLSRHLRLWPLQLRVIRFIRRTDFKPSAFGGDNNSLCFSIYLYLTVTSPSRREQLVNCLNVTILLHVFAAIRIFENVLPQKMLDRTA